MDAVDSLEEIVRNVFAFNEYRNSEHSEELEFFSERIRLGKIFVAICSNNGILFCPSRFAGYKVNTMEKHIAFEYKHGSITTTKITSVLGFPHEPSPEIEEKYLALCNAIQVVPSNKIRSYWIVQDRSYEKNITAIKTSANSGYPDEIDSNKKFPEGSSKQVTVNAYERNHGARKVCIEHHGARCAVCEMSFEAVYGEIGNGYIHVHHIRPLALRDTAYEVDPITDLNPVCPNCHAMLHRSDPPFTIEELRELLVKNHKE
ncbi:HNH endonuclease [Halorhodospira halochloris]|uniref:HNH endonuclease n=1 Tax=Halorhodospira halochloris TaxID=1052 RepID=UPI001EE78AC1|nr:HNH endonuclease [Halorhodospira halochloris]MCG5531278.1 HNH endonuclease [Halorhodospira halochloris]